MPAPPPGPRDTLFEATTEVRADFQFNSKVAEVFDDMLLRSVPCYTMVTEMTARLLETLLQPGDQLHDLGCSTGSTLIELARQLKPLHLRYTGVDNSPAMIAKARLKAEMYCPHEEVAFIEQDIMAAELHEVGGVLLNYTLQFVRPLLRPDFLRRIYDGLRPGGVLVLSEKIISHDPALNRHYIDIYLQFKRARGYSELEITKKREALENVLIPFSIAENQELLRHAGFRQFEPFFQWFNFVSWVAIK